MESSILKTTKQIEKKYNISRQTIHNWINQGLLKSPKKDFRNWFIWEKEDEDNLIEIIEQKTQKYNNSVTEYKNKYLQISNRRYLGSKQKLLEFIEEVVDTHTENVCTVADLFAGTGVVSKLFQGKGKKIIVNDILHSNYISYQTWFGNDKINYTLVKKLIKELNNLEAIEDNYVSLNFGDKYFSMDNARKIGAIREKIETYNLKSRERAFLLTSLLYAMDKVANTVGHYDAYRKKMDTYIPLTLRVPEFLRNKNNEIYQEDANKLVKKISADLVYIDTPYNSRQYGDAYHLLENIIDWKKPKVEGVGKKMLDRSHIKSYYSTQKAPEVFDDLISNINAKYILVSYNNMAQKGNGRSNAKISNKEILNSLEKRGKVEVFDIPFKTFTTGKTNIEDHRELLYLCYVKQSVTEKKYIQSAINYTGGKYRLLPQIIPLLPDNIMNFYDIFAGGANVAVNADVRNNIIINDIETRIIQFYQYIIENDFNTILRKINRIVKQYGLSNSKTNGYKFYNANSSDGLKEINKPQYEKLRKDYNNRIFNKKDEPLIFYILTIYSFNNQIRFNNNGRYNVPVGKRDFNSRMELKLKKFRKSLLEKQVNLLSQDFRVLLENINDPNDFVYLDPPYLISTASYNENGGWCQNDEIDLLTKLDALHAKGVKFALSNVLQHKGKENAILKDWSNKYNIHYLDFNYNNSNYHSTANNNKTVEVLITNY